MEEKIKIGSDGWFSLLGEISARYADGSLIQHEWLKNKFGLKKLSLKDFETVDDFLKGVETQQFAYMSLVDRLRWDLLENYKMFMRNIRGEGYSIVKSNEQTQYGYDLFLREMKKQFHDCGLIMNKVRDVDLYQQSSDNDLRAKFGMMKQMFNNIK